MRWLQKFPRAAGENLCLRKPKHYTKANIGPNKSTLVDIYHAHTLINCRVQRY